MRTEFIYGGWKEITTKVFRVQKVFKELMAISDWLAFNKKHPSIGRKRTRCNACKFKWEVVPGTHVYLIFTDKGNKVVCKKCFDGFSKEIATKPERQKGVKGEVK